VREGHKPSREEKETYHFFIGNVKIQQFMAFLIPSIDFGHGFRRPDDKEPKQKFDKHRLQFDDNWDKYLDGIGMKVQEASEEGHIKASRIILFDKQRLLLFIFNSDWVFREVKAEKHSPLTIQAESLIQYCFDIVMVQRKVKKYKEIKCRYVAESVVAANECYDFGLYKIDGVQIVYSPICLKDGDGTIKREKVFIGNTFRQKSGIVELVEDFECLWKAGDQRCNNQSHGGEEAITQDKLREPSSKLFKLDFLTPEFFDEIYCKEIKRLLKVNLDVEFEAEL